MRRMLAVVMTTVLALAGCGGEAEPTTDQAAAESAASETEDLERSEAEASPSLVVDKIGGGQIDFADLLGQDAVLWFWAPW